MRDFNEFKRSAIRYWERRRIFYNLALLPPACFGYVTMSVLPAAIGDHRYLSGLTIINLFALSALGANICYTFAYALEFLFGDGSQESQWSSSGRATWFILGTLLAILLAFFGGRNIAVLQYTYR